MSNLVITRIKMEGKMLFFLTNDYSLTKFVNNVMLIYSCPIVGLSCVTSGSYLEDILSNMRNNVTVQGSC